MWSATILDKKSTTRPVTKNPAGCWEIWRLYCRAHCMEQPSQPCEESVISGDI